MVTVYMRLLQRVLMTQLAGLLLVYLEFEGVQQAGRYTNLITERKLTPSALPPKNPDQANQNYY